MPRYRALVKCFIDNGLRNEGDVFNYDGPPSPYVEPVDPVPTKRDVGVEVVVDQPPAPRARTVKRTPVRRMATPPAGNV